MVVGTGTGGLVAYMLGPLRMSTHDAKQEYLRIHASNFLTSPEPSLMAEVLKDALKGVLDSRTEDFGHGISTMQMTSVGKLAPTCKFAVTAMTAANLSKPVMLRGYRGRSSPIKCTLLEALLATLSDAQVLPPVPIGESVLEYFVAATTGRCNPTGTLLEELPTVFEAREISVIVSIGSGRPAPAVVTGQDDFLQAVLNLAQSCHEVSQSMESRFSRHPGLFV
ncbi:hypothetical protein DL96DRAFT_346513 [Flagelloscypha sp. PMI_526]|nr:hypothetical protein DL96DRAFT_346513 [Flagelloscypha sp. PMI_526]